MSLKIFSGTSNPLLSESIAQTAGTSLAQVEVTRFKNSEVRVRIEEDVKHDTCVIIQSTSNPTDTNLIELYLMCDALRREEARRVIGVVPYFGYARQDIQHRPGECVSSNVIIRFMEAIGFHKIYTVNLHDEATEGVFSIPFKNLSALPLLADGVRTYLTEKNISISPETVAIVSPDQGGIERARKFGESLFGNGSFQLAVTEKKRDLENMHKSKALDLYGDVKDKVAIIVDDIATSGDTLIHAAEFCIESGANSVIASIVHRDFAPDTSEKIQNSIIEAFFTTDTIALKDEYQFEKMKTVSVAKLIGEELKNLPVNNI
ncbi:MAG TPA: ribose-phosphate pyrophosphokinase [Candidatus Woesebacteria bacterium]|nr:ribose-phosphate pyrophosphokinase [Candidatus Woesebacteria bacterium]